MEENVEQHKMFHDGLRTMEDYFTQVKKNPSIYDGSKVTEMIDQFGGVFCLHLREEIDTLEPTKLEKIFPDVKVLMNAHFTMMKWNISTSNKLTTLPWVLFPLCFDVNSRLCHIMKLELPLGFWEMRFPR